MAVCSKKLKRHNSIVVFKQLLFWLPFSLQPYSTQPCAESVKILARCPHKCQQTATLYSCQLLVAIWNSHGTNFQLQNCPDRNWKDWPLDISHSNNSELMLHMTQLVVSAGAVCTLRQHYAMQSGGFFKPWGFLYCIVADFIVVYLISPQINAQPWICSQAKNLEPPTIILPVMLINMIL